MVERTAPSFSHRLGGRPSVTAEVVALARATERLRPAADRILDDPYAELFLGRAMRTALAAWKVNGPTARLAKRLDPGALAFVPARHRYIDEQLTALLDGGAEQLLLLGAGYDSRAYRFAERLGDRPVFEVDLAPISRRKGGIVERHRAELPAVDLRRVEIDFETETLADTLGAAGFSTGARTFVVWEGVSMYLTRAAVKGTLAAVGDLCGPGSRLSMDMWHLVDDPGPLGTIRRAGPGVLSMIGEAVTFGVHPEEIGFFLERQGWMLVDLATNDDLVERYTAGRPLDPSLYLLTAQRS
jgi:methyltransferase (TIGR00027 family)